jgi:aryl-alcohol dehydrogenase-like predicted oxidoreductase
VEYVLLGRTGVKVSRMCFGTMSFGSTSDESTSAAVYARCRQHGINFFDTANGYSGGDAERILGRLIAHERDELVITTKVASKVGDGPNDRGLSRRHIRQQVERSLARLGTDRIDVYFVHHFDEGTPIEETLRALDDLVRDGHVLYLGASNWAAWQVATALGISAREQLARFEVLQPMYSLVKRQAEVEILPLAEAEDLGVIPYSPLGAGMLTGKYGRDRRPDRGRLVENDMYSRRYGEDSYLDIAERFTEHAKSRGVHPATLAVAWVAAHPAVTAPIIGARDVDQLQASLEASELEIDDAWWHQISALSYRPPPATDRSEDRAPSHAAATAA